MSEHLSTIDRALLQTLLRVRGLRPELAVRYPALKSASSVEALRKRMSRLVEAGFLAASKLPDGRLIYRLSHKGVRVVGAPSAFAASPTPAIYAEMLAKAELGMHEALLFLTKPELEILFRELAPGSELPLITGSFVMRRVSSSEQHLDFFMSELRPADELQKRVQIVTEKLSRSPVFNDLIEARLFGFTIVVPSNAAKVCLEAKPLGVETTVEVCEELQTIISLK